MNITCRNFDIYMTIILFLFFIVICSYSFATTANIMTDTGTVSFTLEDAVTDEQRRNGLMYRKTLDDKSGMLFSYVSPRIIYMWMYQTFIPLDMLFIEGNIIRHIEHNATPHDRTPRSSRFPITYAIEIAGGSAKKYGIAVGNHVTLSP